MHSKRFPTTRMLAALAGGLLLLPAGDVIPEELQDIRVLNFPESQKVEGAVSVEGPIRSATMIRFSDLTVSPVPPEQTTRLVHAGTLDVDGYTHVVLSLVCRAQGPIRDEGRVGVILVPAEPPVRQAFVDHGRTLLPVRLDASVEAGSPLFFAAQGGRQALAFPRYDVFLYNTTSSVVGADLFAYVSNG